ncbi:MAG: acyl-CoA dehydratase activase [Dehalococcoidales bacterium]|nr:acyl-CoA dehydratase activase [Dehalococcoidales bacterium]
MTYSLGLDIGSVNAKLSLVDEDGSIVHIDTEEIKSSPQKAVNSLLARLSAEVALADFSGAGVCGSAKSIVPKALNWAQYSSSLAIAAGLLYHNPDAKTIIQIGGQSCLIIELEDGLKKPWKVASNSLCAAGTGRFLEQQAYRLGINMTDFTNLALEWRGSVPRIAGRCSVFAKSDLIHLQQIGVPIEAMLYALCESIARMVASLKKGIFVEPIYFVGGVAANTAIVKALNKVLTTMDGDQARITVPQNHLHVESLGAALLSRGRSSQVEFLTEPDAKKNYFQMPKLEEVELPSNGEVAEIRQPCTGYLGVDVGSTSTKAVILDESGSQVLAKSYLMTAGKPLDAIKRVFQNLLRDGAGMVTIAGVGVTGSGRYLVGSFIGADVIKNEITAQTRAAAEKDPDADIIEIGGQDSKLVIKKKGVVVDYQMNKACAAGTGSFIDELAEMLGVSVKSGEFASMAFTAPHTVELGTRCAAFMAQSVALAQQEGVPVEVITASLANSIAKNYLTKVVGNRRLGGKVILTGAVFYNQAIVSAFRQQLEGKELIVAEHREVSGAIGVALLAREQRADGGSKFKGFEKVLGSDCALSAFTCSSCENNCTITRMKLSDEKATYYGSRCDRYDSTISQGRKETCFDLRERLLFREYREDSGSGPTIGIPRALLVYDYAPLLVGFLNALGVKVVLSNKTDKQIMQQAIELSYSDSCFPVKLLHGHVAALKNSVDYILYPCFVRLGRKEGDENQKYACPLIQGSPFIIRHVLNIEERLLTPVIDFSRGDADTIKSFADVAVKLGFSEDRGKKAALAGIEAQRRFETDRDALGARILAELRQKGKLGVVLLSRAYMSQDSGANLSITEKLAQLGVSPIPLDFLPLNSIDPREYSDRPYWFYESKYLAGAAITVSDQQLYGLAITNFGCGPNSFILKVIEDIMGEKPLGNLEIDEHAAEAGMVTRLEAFVDTITGHSRSTHQAVPSSHDAYRGTSTIVSQGKTLLAPRMSPHVDVIVAALNAYGARATVLPEPDERNLIYSNQFTSGAECLPYRVTLGDFIRFCRENGNDLRNFQGLMAGAYGPCRFGKYAIEQDRVLKELGFDLPIRTSVSNNAYTELDLGPGFLRFVLSTVFAVDCLQRLLWRIRPYEKEKGAAEKLFDEYLSQIADRVRRKEKFYDVLRQAAADFKSLIDLNLPRRPLVGINGEIFLRSNRFSNCNLEKACEDAGLEVVISPIGEWARYVVHRYREDAFNERKLKKIVKACIMKFALEHEERRVARCFRQMMSVEESSIDSLLAESNLYLSSRCGGEAVLSIGAGIHWMKSPELAGVISVMPHGCMPGGIVAAMSEKFSTIYQKPWISLTYDGFAEANNLAKINEFAESIKFCRNSFDS